ncbi:MAG: 50S ribosomal protein L21 [Ignavibacteria bacterium]|nr:50S ribosomal protein L21 [Ignavibacteria bacterium]
MLVALVEIAGQQYEVSEKAQLVVPHLQGEVGETVEFDKILLKNKDGNIEVGSPYLEGKVKATIMEHAKGKKVLVFHKKRRKGHRKLNGFRPMFTKIEVNSIN